MHKKILVVAISGILMACTAKPLLESDVPGHNFFTDPYEVKEKLATKPKGLTLSEKQKRCLYVNVYHEARGEPDIGKKAVIVTTLNRVYSKKFPNTVCQVVYQKGQFVWTKTKKSIREKKTYAKIVKFTDKVVDNYTPKAMNNILFFSVGGFKSPKLTYQFKHGNHKFYSIR